MAKARDIKAMTATAVLSTAPIIITGIVVASHTNGTIALYDSATAAVYNKIFGTITLAAGPQVITFPAPILTDNGLYAVVGGTLDAYLIVGE